MKQKIFSLSCLVFLLTILTPLLLFTSCKQEEPEKEENSTTSDTINDETTAETEPLTLIKDGSAEYEIIYPKGCESVVSAAATSLTSNFKRLTGVDIKVKNDSKTENTVTNKIIVGKTKHAQAQKVFSEMKYYDYRVIFDETNIIVAAYTEEGYDKAISWLCDNVFSKVTESVGGKSLSVKAENYIDASKTEYAVSSWKILGTEISKFRIIYNDKSLYDLVMAFRNKIALECGYFVEIMLDSDAEETEYEILIGDTNRKQSLKAGNARYLTYFAKIVDSKLVIKAGGEHSMPKMLESIYAEFIEGKDEISIDESFLLEGNYFDDPYDSSKPSDSDLRIMSCNILAEFESWSGVEAHYPYLPVSKRKEIFFAALDYYQPTVIGLQELTSAWYNTIPEYADFEKWELLKFTNPNRTDGEYVFSTIMFRKDLYSLVDSGMQFYSKHNNARCRCYTWAILKDNATGKEFCVVSTHWDGGNSIENTLVQVAELSAFVNEMQKKYPVFTTGDFNRNEITDEFKKYLADTEITDAKYSAVLQVNNIGSWHNFTQNDVSWGSCDHITATKDTTVLKYQSLVYNELIYGSDHCWLIADIKFN